MLVRTFWVLVSRGVAALLSFVLTVIVGRRGGATDAGYFFLALSLISTLSLISRLGLDHAVLRFVASEIALGNPEGARSVNRLAIVCVFVTSACLTLLFFSAGPPLVRQLASDATPESIATAGMMMCAIIPFSLNFVYTESIKALGLPALSLFLQGGMTAAVFVVCLLMLPQFQSAPEMASVYVVAAAASCLVSLGVWTSLAPAVGEWKTISLASQVYGAAKSLYPLSLVRHGFTMSMPMLLGIWVSAADIGRYAAAARVALLASLLLMAVNAVVAPRLASANARGDRTELSQLVQWSANVNALVAVPVCMILVLFSSQILGFIEPSFREGSWLLRVLVIGQLVNALTGSIAVLLTMSGHERALKVAVFEAAAVGLAATLLLVPLFGVTGGAVGVALSVAWVNVRCVWFGYKCMNIVSLPRFASY